MLQRIGITSRIAVVGCIACVLLCICGLIGFGIMNIWANTVTSHEFPLKQRWTYQADGYVSAIAVNPDGEIIIRTTGSITKLNPDSGELIWFKKIPGNPVASPPIISGNIVVVSSSIGTYAYNLETGDQLWTDRKDRSTPGNDFTAAANDDVVVTIGQFMDVRDLHTGELLWQTTEYLPRRALAAVDNNHVYLILFDQIKGYDLATGELLWSVETPTWSLFSSLFEDGILYLEEGTEGGGVGAFDVETQEMIWVQKDNLTTFSNPVTKYENYLFVPVAWGSPVMLDAETGEVVWKATETPKATYLMSSVMDNTVYVKNYQNRDIYVLDLKNGSLKGYLDLGFGSITSKAGVSTGPVLSGSSIIFSDKDRVFAYDK